MGGRSLATPADRPARQRHGRTEADGMAPERNNLGACRADLVGRDAKRLCDSMAKHVTMQVRRFGAAV